MHAVVRVVVAASALAIVLSLTPRPVAGAAKWDPIDPKELAATQPVVQKDADAEVLLWDVRVADEAGAYSVNTVYSHYLRIKIYTDRGRDAQTRVEIPFLGSTTVEGVEGRSIGRDGSFTELKKSDVFVRDLVKAGGSKVRALTFALPAVETGGLVEYRWREIHGGTLSQNLRLAFSRDIPVQRVRYHVVPFRRWVMSHVTFHTNATLAISDEYAVGIFSTDQVPATGFSMANVPANEEEPHAPPDWEVRPWMLVYYDMDSTPSVPREYWTRFSQKTAESQRKTTAPTPEIRRAAASLSLDALSLNQKLAALVAFCRRRSSDSTWTRRATPSARGSAATSRRPRRSPPAGEPPAMSSACSSPWPGPPASTHAWRLLPSRNDVTFDPALMLKQLLKDEVVAVRDGDRWRFLDPTNESRAGRPPDVDPGARARARSPTTDTLVSADDAGRAARVVAPLADGHAAPLGGRHARGRRDDGVHRPLRHGPQGAGRPPRARRARDLAQGPDGGAAAGHRDDRGTGRQRDGSPASPTPPATT